MMLKRYYHFTFYKIIYFISNINLLYNAALRDRKIDTIRLILINIRKTSNYKQKNIVIVFYSYLINSDN